LTYETDIDSEQANVGYFVAFDGVEKRIATHDMAAHGVAGSFAVLMAGVPTGGGTELDRDQGTILPAGFAFNVLNNAEGLEYVRRRGGETWPLAQAIGRAPADTTVWLDGSDKSGQDGRTIYVGKETIVLGIEFGTTGAYIASMRGSFGSAIAAHPGGTVAATVPRNWLDRRGILHAVNLATGSSKAIRAGLVRRSPVFKDGVWGFELYDVETELNRPIMTGWELVSITRAPIPITETLLGVDFLGWDLQLGDGDAKKFRQGQFVIGLNTVGSQVKVVFGDVVEVFDQLKVDEATDRLTVLEKDLIWTNREAAGGRSALEDAQDVKAKQVQFIAGDPAKIALHVMLSGRGDGTNQTAYDSLPGRDPDFTGATVFDVSRRCGANLPADYVDIPSWQDGVQQSGDSFRGVARKPIAMLLDEETTLFDWLRDEILWRLGGYVVATPDGKLALQQYQAAIPAADVEILDASDETIVTSVQTVDDETDILGRVAWESNYRYDRRIYELRTEASFQENADVYGDRRKRMDLQSKSLWVGEAPPGVIWDNGWTPNDMVTALDRHFARTKDGVRKTSVRVPFALQDFSVGKRLRYTDPRMPDNEGGTGVVVRPYEVTGVNPDYKAGVWDLQAEEMKTGRLVAPAGVVSNVASNTLTLLGDPDLFDALPGEDFAAGWSVRIYDEDSGTPLASEVEVIASVSGDTITLVSLPGSFGVAPGDVVALEYSGDTTVNAINAIPSDYIFNVDTAGKIDPGGPAEIDGTEWI